MTSMPMRALLLAGTALVTPLFSQTAFAQDIEDDFDLGEIRIEQDAAQEALGNLTISEEEIERRNPASIQDVFDGESAINASGGPAIAKKVFVNGIEESLLNVTIDGARQNKSAFHHTGNVLIDPGLLKAVEVSSGLAPADIGPGGLGGTLSYTTKDPSDLLDADKNFGGRISISGGDNGFGLRSTLSLYGQTGGFEYLLHGASQNGSDYADGNGNSILGTGADITDVMAKVAYTTKGGHRLSFTASETKDTGDRLGQQGPGPLFFIRPDFGGLNGLNSVLLPAEARRTSYSATYTIEDAQGWFDPFVQLAYNEQEITAGSGTGKNTSFSGTFKNTFQLGNGTLSAGLDFFDETAEGSTGPYGGKETNRNVGLFAQARQDLSARTSLSYGARIDIQDFEGADGSTFSETGISANASVDYILTESWSLNAGIASTFGGFALGEAMIINLFEDQPFGAPWEYSGFKPARSNSARLGARFERGAWVASGAVFYTEINDLAAVLPSRGARGALTDIKTQGLDGSLAYVWDTGFARMNYTYADVSEQGDTISSTAYYRGRPLGHLVALETAWHPRKEWTIGGTAEIAPKYSDANMESYSVFNAYAEYIPPSMENFRVRFDVRNLFNETYVARTNDSAGDSAGRPIPLNEPGRTLAITATLSF